jgi:adenosylcobinamide-phosphate synthase
MTFVVIVCALAADRIFGEPSARWHPLVAFGRIAARLEGVLRRRTASLRIAGVVAVALLVAPAAALAHVVSVPIVDAMLLYLAIAPRSLREHALRVADALKLGDLASARAAVSQIVSRDTAGMSTDDVARAAVESVLENGNDAVFGALFWFIALGAPGAVLYRLANTLDAMWGYRNEAYLRFGWAAARFDDLLNLLPARLTALSYAVAGSTAAALRCWRTQASTWYSPNAGPVMAAGAGALQVQLGGPASYGGRRKERPVLGCGATPGVEDIERAIALVDRSLVIWIAGAAMLFAARGFL